MKRIHRRAALAAGLATIAAPCAPSVATAQGCPAKSVTPVVPFDKLTPARLQIKAAGQFAD
jgi:hypothetical protein